IANVNWKCCSTTSKNEEKSMLSRSSDTKGSVKWMLINLQKPRWIGTNVPSDAWGFKMRNRQQEYLSCSWVTRLPLGKSSLLITLMNLIENELMLNGYRLRISNTRQ